MSLSRMKPLPKALIILAIVGGIGYGAKTYLDSRPPQAVTGNAPVTQVPAETAQTPAAPSSIPNAPAAVVEVLEQRAAQQAAPTPSGLTPAPTDAGVANVLRSVK